MRYFYTLPLLVVLLVSSCSSVSNMRRDIEEMSQPEYTQLKAQILSIADIASNRISQNWSHERKNKAFIVINDGIALINDPSRLQELDITNIIGALGDRYSDKMGLDAQARSDIRDVTLLIDILVGPIKLDINAELSEREQGLLLTLLHGLGDGLIR